MITAPDHRVFLGMPGYGSLTAAAARGFWRASRYPNNVCQEYREGSLLAANFNALWCRALNKRHKGEQLDYFAMQHADVEPEDFWLDALIEEMEDRDLDLLGVVVPIKDTRGVTSIALGRPDGDNWRVHCRLTMDEVFRLPQTFTSKDVGYPLLLNTGLWVCRFNPAWAKQVHFEINDRIVFDTAKNNYTHEVESEDWYFSRLCHEIGLKIGATRKIRLSHRGDMQFTNTTICGEKYDSAHVSESVVPDLPPGTFRFPYDVDGWLTEPEGNELAELARGKRVLEIGSYCGRSTICMAQTAERVVSVDTHDGRGTAVPRNTFGDLRGNLVHYEVNDKVSCNYCTAKEFTELFGDNDPFDLIFIDGCHDYESVKSDIDDALSMLSPDGLIAFHDYLPIETPYGHGNCGDGVTEAVTELLSAGAELLSTHDTLAVVRPPAAILQEA